MSKTKTKTKNKKSKWLFTFKINKTTVEEISKKEEKDGEEVTITKKVDKRIPVLFKLLKPTRKLYDEAELFYGVKMAEGIKAGLLTRQLLAKRYENDGGVFSDPEKKRYADLYVEINECENNYQKLQIDHRGMNQKQIARKSETLLSEMMEKRRELLDIENSRSDIFDQTAENRAKNQVIMWWVLHLAYTLFEEGDDTEMDTSWSPLFGEGKYDERLERYDEVEERDDDFNVDIIKKFAYLVSFWYMGRAQSREDFEDIEKFYLLENETEEDQQMREDEEAEAEAKEVEESREAILKEEEKKKEEAKKTEEANKIKEAKEAEEAKKAEVATAVKAEEDKRKAEAEETKKAEKAKKAEEDKKAEKDKKTEETQLAELQKAESNKTEEPKEKKDN